MLHSCGFLLVSQFLKGVTGLTCDTVFCSHLHRVRQCGEASQGQPHNFCPGDTMLFQLAPYRHVRKQGKAIFSFIVYVWAIN
uniref:Putative secreted protein n=1 Tax=Ixodes ricinus TaxID=34613 RepID=A0A6B0TWZ4_IXORI